MKCEAIKLNSERCNANSLRDGSFCFRHDNKQKNKARQASSNGGQSRRLYNRLGNHTRLETPKDIQNLMAKAINHLWTGRMPSNNPAGSLGYMAKIFLEAYEKSELEERVELLEKRLNRAEHDN